ncbi:MAG: tRNA lysidine(34) synthetase TilS [Steroidobacteraceae bacterium]
MDSERRKEPLARRIEAALAALLPEYPHIALAVAFSGGLDSSVLLAALAGLKRRPPLRAIHIDHALHPSSGAWAAHCRSAAGRLDVPLTVSKIEVRRARGASLEAAAREARYAALAHELGEGEVLLTAQHADDQLETVLLQLLRGAGLRGLAAMPAVAPFGPGRITRPLLEMQRVELEAWAHERALEWVEDATNSDERLDRNYLRRQVVPLLRARWRAAGRAVSRAARHAAEAQRLLDLLGRADVERAAVADALAVTRLRALPEDRRRNALRYWIAARGHPLPDARRLTELAGALIAARADAHPQVQWGDTLARREGDRLSLQRTGASARCRGEPAPGAHVTDVAVRAKRSDARIAQFELEWYPREAALELPEPLGRLELAADPHGPIDLDALRAPLTVRLRRGGERLRLTRGGPRRLLKSLLQEARIPDAERARMPLVWSGERLLAAADLWVDAEVRAEAGRPRRGRLIWHRCHPAPIRRRLG